MTVTLAGGTLPLAMYAVMRGDHVSMVGGEPVHDTLVNLNGFGVGVDITVSFSLMGVPAP